MNALDQNTESNQHVVTVIKLPHWNMDQLNNSNKMVETYYPDSFIVLDKYKNLDKIENKMLASNNNFLQAIGFNSISRNGG